MDIRNVALVGPGYDTLSDSVIAGEDEIVPGQIELLDRQWHERQKTAIMSSH
jgi:hypothetical protein